ncbi:TRMT5 family protein [Megaselia abdita]
MLRSFRFRHFWKNMNSEILHPPKSVRGLKKLDKELFKKEVSVPVLTFPEENSNKILPSLKKFLLKMEKMKPVRSSPIEKHREVLLHPLAVQGWSSLPIDTLSSLNVKEENYSTGKLNLTYDNWRADELLKSILPENEEGVSSYSKIGHIIHINLRDQLLPFKEIIGEILLDKIPGCESVVNKTNSIDNTFRNFQLELICGKEDYLVEVKENGVIYEFDFSKVYWNPRLSTEHERIVKLLKPNDVLYDVFGGVGPFSVPAAKKKCRVLGNDLNPESFKWLNRNVTKNKCKDIKTFNKDGKDFILEDIKEDLMKVWEKEDDSFSIHITMNLPAMAIEFLHHFRGLFRNEQNLKDTNNRVFPLIHVYTFIKGDNSCPEETKKGVRKQTEDHLGVPIPDKDLEGLYFVRNVAPNKDMYRVSFFLNDDILFEETRKRKSSTELCPNESKVLC